MAGPPVTDIEEARRRRSKSDPNARMAEFALAQCEQAMLERDWDRFDRWFRIHQRVRPRSASPAFLPGAAAHGRCEIPSGGGGRTPPGRRGHRALGEDRGGAPRAHGRRAGASEDDHPFLVERGHRHRLDNAAQCRRSASLRSGGRRARAAGWYKHHIEVGRVLLPARGRNRVRARRLLRRHEGRPSGLRAARHPSDAEAGTPRDLQIPPLHVDQRHRSRNRRRAGPGRASDLQDRCADPRPVALAGMCST
jgi:hypothetical protein